MKNLFRHSSHTTTKSASGNHHSFALTMMEDNVAAAESNITKWDVDGSAYAKITSIFYESRDEAARFIAAVSSLKRAMQFFISDHSSAHSTKSDVLSRGNRLMETAMKRLQKEFYQILAANRERLDSESLSRASISRASTSSSFSHTDDNSPTDEDEVVNVAEAEKVVVLPTEAMGDLRAIAECMISTGYTKECAKVYKTIRRSIVDEGLYRLGFDRLSASQIHKFDWESVEHRMRSWHSASHVAVETLFSGERFLSDYVFGFSDSIKEWCFAEVTKDTADKFFAFPAIVAAKPKNSPERVFQFLDLHDSISELLPAVESLFSCKSTSSVPSHTLASLHRLSEAVRSTLADFESVIQKDASRSLVPGGGLHPLTRYVMNYLAFLGDYSDAIAEIYADHPIPAESPLPDSFINTTTTSSRPSSPILQHSSTLDEEDSATTTTSTVPPPHVSSRMAWLLLVLLCKLDGKAKLYKNTSLSYLFLANNLHYIVQKVRGSKLRHLLGLEWVVKNDEKARLYAGSYVRSAWRKVSEAVPEDPMMLLEEKGLEAVKDRMRGFNEAFEDAYRAQCAWVVADGRMREAVKLSIARKVIGPYREFYDVCRPAMRLEVRFSPKDLGNCISDLFCGNAGSNGASSGGSTASVSGSA